MFWDCGGRPRRAGPHGVISMRGDAGSAGPYIPGTLLFISDLHLHPADGPRTEAFRAFLADLEKPPRPAHLYILGDLFDTWTGRASLAEPAWGTVLESLSALSGAGVPVTILQGNRDFLLDGRFARRAGASIVEESIILRLGDRRAYLCHGDRLFPLDRAHQRLRWILRGPMGKAMAEALPPWAVTGIARWLRSKSRARGLRQAGGDGPGPLYGKRIPAESAARLLRGGFDILIAGHVHEERRWTLEVDGRIGELYTLGSWDREGSVLEFDGSGFRFRRLPLAGQAGATWASGSS